ncbi:Fe-S cluster assembly protein SufD [Roseivirga echinicomitans]
MEKIVGQSILDSLETQFAAFEKRLNGQSKSAVHAVRKEAFNILMGTGFPGPKNEAYKYTNFTRAIEKNFELKDANADFSLNETQVNGTQIADLDAHKIVFLNGHYSSELSDKIEVEGLKIESLEAELKANSELAQKNFGSKANFTDDAFVALNTAFSQHGVTIEIADKAVIEKPIVLYFIGDSSNAKLSYHIRNIVVAGKFSKATIIEKFDTIGAHKSFTTSVNEVSVDESAHLRFFKIENDTTEAYHISNIHVNQEANSNFKAFTFSLNGAMIRNNLNVKLQAEGIETYMNGLYLLDGKTHVDNHTIADHMMPNCYSNELYKGIMDDSSKGVFNGKIFVRADAQKTNAFQSNKNILLSDSATVNTKPQLEIWADDVSCSHGCTTGQLDMDALFYLQARGIQKDKARAILLKAFASDVLETVENKAIKEYLTTIIKKRLEI